MIASLHNHQNPQAGLLLVYSRMAFTESSGRHFGTAGHWLRRRLEISPYKSQLLWNMAVVPGTSPAQVRPDWIAWS